MKHRTNSFQVHLAWSAPGETTAEQTALWGPGPARTPLCPRPASELRAEAEEWFNARFEAAARARQPAESVLRGGIDDDDEDFDDDEGFDDDTLGRDDTVRPTTAGGRNNSPPGAARLLNTIVGDETDPAVIVERFQGLYTDALATCSAGTIAGVQVQLEFVDTLPSHDMLRLCVSIGDHVALVAPDCVQAPPDTDLARLTAAWCLWLGYGDTTLDPPEAYFPDTDVADPVTIEASRRALARSCGSIAETMRLMTSPDDLFPLFRNVQEESLRYMPEYEAAWIVSRQLRDSVEASIDEAMTLAALVDDDAAWDLCAATMRDASRLVGRIPSEWLGEEVPGDLDALFAVALERATVLRGVSVAEWVANPPQQGGVGAAVGHAREPEMTLRLLRWMNATESECVACLSPDLWRLTRYGTAGATMTRLRIAWVLRDRDLAQWEAYAQEAEHLTEADLLAVVQVARESDSAERAVALVERHRSAFAASSLAQVLPWLLLWTGRVDEAADLLRDALLPEGMAGRPRLDASIFRLYTACAATEASEQLREHLLFGSGAPLEQRAAFAVAIGDVHALAALLPQWLEGLSSDLSRVESKAYEVSSRIRILHNAGFRQVVAEVGESLTELLVQSRRYKLYIHAAEAMRMVVQACAPYPEQHDRALRWIDDLKARFPNRRTLWQHW